MPPVAGSPAPVGRRGRAGPGRRVARRGAELGDTFVVDSGRDRMLFVFSPESLRDLYALPESVREQGPRGLPDAAAQAAAELFADRRTFAHDLFGAQDVEGYLGHLDVAIARAARRARRRRDVRGLRAGAPARPPARARVLDGRCRGRAAVARRADRRLRGARRGRGVRPPRAGRRGRRRPHHGARGARRGSRTSWAGSSPRAHPRTGSSPRSTGDGPTRPARAAPAGVAGDVVLLHVATMTNLFAALGWTVRARAAQPGRARARSPTVTTPGSSAACSSRSGWGNGRS